MTRTSWRVGTIGFAYDDWAHAFFPPGLNARNRLGYYGTQFNAIELDTTFYALPAIGIVERWRSVVPDDFLFALKAPRDLTHQEAPGSLIWPTSTRLWHDFMVLVEALGPERTIVLLQFPPAFRSNRLTELTQFLSNFSAPCRVAIEFRHRSWWSSGVDTLLRSHGIAWVSADRAPVGEAAWEPEDPRVQFPPEPVQHTATWAYLRLCGQHGQYESDANTMLDATPRLRWWTEHIVRASQDNDLPSSSVLTLFEPENVQEVVAFCGNSFAGYGVETADQLLRLVGLRGRFALQPSLFADH